MTPHNHPNPEALYPALKRHEVLLLAMLEKGWIKSVGLAVLVMRADDRERLLAHWENNGLVEFQIISTVPQSVEYRATRAGKFVVKGWREAGWIE